MIESLVNRARLVQELRNLHQSERILGFGFDQFAPYAVR